MSKNNLFFDIKLYPMPYRILTLAFCFFLSVAHAQVKIGVEAGPDFARLLGAGYGSYYYSQYISPNTQTLTRFYGGVFADIPLEKQARFLLRPHLLYLGTGGKFPQRFDFNGNLLYYAFTYKLNYIDLPVQLLYSPSLSFGKPWIGGGLYYGVLLNGKIITPQFTERMLIGGDPYHNNARRFDAGFNATAGMTLKCGAMIGVDFQQGLKSISYTNRQDFGGPRGTRNSLWRVHLGYEWRLKQVKH